MSEQRTNPSEIQNPKMVGRLEGLANLLGVSPSGLEAANYPDTVNLPIDVHQPAYDALQQTLGDGRERQLSYNYHDGTWQLKVETGPEVDFVTADRSRTRSLLKSIYHSTLKRPLIALHTHPRIDDESLSRRIRHNYPDSHSWAPEFGRAMHEGYRAVDNLMGSFPSPDDVRVARSRFPKELVQMLYTPFSAFMMVRTNLSGSRQKREVADHIEYRQLLGRYTHTYLDVASGTSVAEERAKLLDGLAVALGDEYSLFYSFRTPAADKPPTLTKYKPRSTGA